MEISAFAESVLRSGNLEDKLWFPAEGIVAFTDHDRASSSFLADLSEPGRPASLKFEQSDRNKVAFPTAAELKQQSARGLVLHFFANHELLAMEIMALALLRFPDAPEKFRLGIVQTIAEEQNHMRLYMQRMQEYGVPFGAVPVNRFFWDLLRDMKTPLDYVTRMSLTFEQANLDYSLHYQQLFEQLHDEETAKILHRVYSEEIGHVKYGVTWFNRWRAPETSDWQAYNELLPFPMTPSRAKGIGFDRDGRRSAGLSETFVNELFVYQHSKGRPPVIYFFNPSAEMETLYPLQSFTEPAPVADVRHDLGSLMMFFAHSDDVVVVDEKPSLDFLRTSLEAGLKLPQFATWSELSGRTVTRFEPWGRTKYSGQLIAGFSGRMLEPAPETVGAKFFSKQWCAETFGPLQCELGFPVEVLTSMTAIKEKVAAYLQTCDQPLVLKAPFGSSGRNMIRIMRPGIEPNQEKWIAATLRSQGALVAEPWVRKISDLSVQLEVGPERVRILGITRFITDRRGQYVGHFLGKKFFNLDSEFHRQYHDLGLEHKLAAATAEVGRVLQNEGFRGPAGMDAFIWQDAGGIPRLRPCMEINPRYTMGRVALEIERKMVPHKGAALWLHIGARMTASFGSSSLSELAEALKNRYGDEIFFTNDPAITRSILSVVFNGDACNAAIDSVLPALI
jgi:uncharacterized ferritin-like protein (DUF455 family)